MFLADAQVHIWAPNSPHRPWVQGLEPHRAVALEADGLLREMDAAGVARAILIPPSWDGGRNDLVLRAAREHPRRFAVMGRLEQRVLDDPARLAGWREERGMLGFRVSFNRPREAAALIERRLEGLWAAAAAHEVPVMIYTSHDKLPLIDEVAGRHPRLKIALSHLSLPMQRRDEEAFAGLDRLLALARHANVAVKASALPAYTGDSYPYRRLHPYLKRVYAAYGPRRMFWGTDLARQPCSYAQAVAMFTQEMPWLGEEDKAWIMGRALCEWLRWPLEGSG